MTIFLNLCPLILIAIIPQQIMCVQQAYFLRKQQKYLANHAIETKQAYSEFECGSHCVADGSCASVNFKTSGDDKGRCELTDKALQEIPDKGTRDPEFTHLAEVKGVSKIIQWILDELSYLFGHSILFETKITQPPTSFCIMTFQKA